MGIRTAGGGWAVGGNLVVATGVFWSYYSHTHRLSRQKYRKLKDGNSNPQANGRTP